jgi:ADP-heptose:LPS heptosyltransferase
LNEKVLYFKSWLASKYINLLGGASYPFKSILIIKNDEIGDLITAMPVFYNLHKLYPETLQTLVCKPFNTIFFKHIDYIQCIHHLDEAKGNYDLIVDLRGDNYSLKYALVNRPKYRVDRGSIRLKNKLLGGQKNEIDTNLQIIQPLYKKELDPSNRLIISNVERTVVQNFLKLNGITKCVIIHLGARDEARRWPIDRYAKTINYINKAYSMPCILVGGTDDVALNKKCLSIVTSKHNYNVAGDFDLLQYAALCEQASLFVGNESGPLHIAAAMNTPNIALFGPGVRDVFYPQNEKSIVHHYFLARGHQQQSVENSTIFNISVEEVVESIDLILTALN